MNGLDPHPLPSPGTTSPSWVNANDLLNLTITHIYHVRMEWRKQKNKDNGQKSISPMKTNILTTALSELPCASTSAPSVWGAPS